MAMGFAYNLVDLDGRSCAGVEFVDPDLELGAKLLKVFDAQENLPAELLLYLFRQACQLSQRPNLT